MDYPTSMSSQPYLHLRESYIGNIRKIIIFGIFWNIRYVTIIFTCVHIFMRAVDNIIFKSNIFQLYNTIST